MKRFKVYDKKGALIDIVETNLTETALRYIAKYAPSVTLIEVPRNLGFAMDESLVIQKINKR